MNRTSILVAGAGGIGRAVALLLANSEYDIKIYIGDAYQAAAEDALQWINKGLSSPQDIQAFTMPKEENSEELEQFALASDIILDCLPGSQAPRMAALAIKSKAHYINLTEYVHETEQIMEMGKDAETACILQAGLAPGFINILANKLAKDFLQEYKVDKLKDISMKVGALAENAVAPHQYAFTWSSIGVATEYVKDAIVMRDGQIQHVPSLSQYELLRIDGVELEADLTSGGAADIPQAYEGRVENVDYKTMRYPGHFPWVKVQLESIGDVPDKIEQLQQRMLDTIPFEENDIVYVYARVTGKDDKGVFRAIDKYYKVRPLQIGEVSLRAIQSTTAGPMAQLALMLIDENLKGIVLQSEIDPEKFLNGSLIQLIYGK